MSEGPLYCDAKAGMEAHSGAVGLADNSSSYTSKLGDI